MGRDGSNTDCVTEANARRSWTRRHVGGFCGECVDGYWVSGDCVYVYTIGDRFSNCYTFGDAFVRLYVHLKNVTATFKFFPWSVNTEEISHVAYRSLIPSSTTTRLQLCPEKYAAGLKVWNTIKSRSLRTLHLWFSFKNLIIKCGIKMSRSTSKWIQNVQYCTSSIRDS